MHSISDSHPWWWSLELLRHQAALAPFRMDPYYNRLLWSSPLATSLNTSLLRHQTRSQLMDSCNSSNNWQVRASSAGWTGRSFGEQRHDGGTKPVCTDTLDWRPRSSGNGAANWRPRSPVDGAAANDSLDVETERLKELERFATDFKQRRIRLGFTQTNVGKLSFTQTMSVNC